MAIADKYSQSLIDIVDMRIFIICNSDQLSLPVIHQLQVTGKLSGVGILKKSAPYLVGPLTSIGVDSSMIHELNSDQWISDIKKILADINPSTVWVLTFPYMIPDELLNIPIHGWVNFHYGKLPSYKGNDPVFWQIKNMEPTGGLTVHSMTSKLDEGPVLLSEPVPIAPGETYGLHCQKLGIIASRYCDTIISNQQNGKFLEDIVGHPPGLYEKKPNTADLTIDWSRQSANEIEALVNATNPKYDGAITSINGIPIRLIEVSPADLPIEHEIGPGMVVHADVVYGIIVSCIERKFLRINIAKINEGYVSGVRLYSLGISKGAFFK